MNEAELLFTGVLGCSRAELYLNKNTRLKKDHSRVIAAALKRRISGEPLQYILGVAEFMGLKFNVDNRALIPRPETELLVEKALAWLKMHPSRRLAVDVGTGSGCIAVSLAHGMDDLRMIALAAVDPHRGQACGDLARRQELRLGLRGYFLRGIANCPGKLRVSSCRGRFFTRRFVQRFRDERAEI